MFKRLIIFIALVIGSLAVAHADPIASYASTDNDSFTSPTNLTYSYSDDVIINGNGTDACAGGNTCPMITGIEDGTFTQTATDDYTTNPTIFLFTSQYSLDAQVEDFSKSTSVLATVPEPASLVLFGIGVIGIAVLTRRSRANS